MICVPIVGPGMEQALQDIETCYDLADFIELRLDLISAFDLRRLMKACTGKPCIVTNRAKMDGGQFPGTEEERVADASDVGVRHIDEQANRIAQGKGDLA